MAINFWRVGIGAILGAVLAIHSANAQGTPNSGDLISAIAPMVPPFWVVSGINITAAENEGSLVSPLVRQRFVATATAETALFVKADEQFSNAPFSVVLETFSVGTVRKLYGTAGSTYRAGKWEIEVDLENSLIELGKPITLFEGPTYIAGSQDLQTAIDQMSFIGAAAREFNEIITLSETRRSHTLELLEAERIAFEDEKSKQLGILQEIFEQTREKLVASEQIRTKNSIARLETAELQKLEAALIAQAEQNKRTEEARRANAISGLEVRKSYYDNLIEKIGGGNLTLAKAAFDSAMQSEDKEFIRFAARLAIQSGHSELKAAALAWILLQKPVFSITFQGDKRWVLPVSIDSIDTTTLRFRATVDKDDSEGSVSHTTLTIRGLYSGNCSYSLTVQKTGNLKGTASCGSQLMPATADLF